jgi:hypothetical protein
MTADLWTPYAAIALATVQITIFECAHLETGGAWVADARDGVSRGFRSQRVALCARTGICWRY